MWVDTGEQGYESLDKFMSSNRLEVKVGMPQLQHIQEMLGLAV